jgi:hypothetical protein
LPEEYLSGVQNCLYTKECQFDLATVQAYQSSLSTIKNQNDPLRHFSNYLKAGRQAIESQYEARFRGRMNSGMLKAIENELDPGFMKLCGLKGSKLSGG